ncbi:MAG: hypothetical protein IRZ04_05545 [Rhodospirillales bacterium]|nr:hypothetical protein [Rhodospirillales bacterium]
MTALFAVLVTAVSTMAAGIAAAQETPAKPPRAVSLYKTADSAACSDDVTVWVDPERRLYYVKGDPLYGKTRPGGYNCRRHVEAAGYRPGRQATPR